MPDKSKTSHDSPLKEADVPGTTDKDLSEATFISANEEEENGDFEFLCCSGSLLG